MVVNHYDHIWDCCCDHGLLGMTLLKRRAADTVHFVDIVEPLIVKLETKLKRFFSREDVPHRWQLHIVDVAQLPLDCFDEKQTAHLIIIAGVGGDQTINMVNAILKNHPQKNLEFLLCPVHQIYKVRRFLIDQQLGLIDEQLIKDNQRFYELIHVSTLSKRVISEVGQTMWDLSRADDREYLEKNIRHFQNKCKALNQSDKIGEFREILRAYQMITERYSDRTIFSR